MYNTLRFEDTLIPTTFLEYKDKVFKDVKKNLDNSWLKEFTSTSGHSKILFSYEKYKYTILMENITILQYETLKKFIYDRGSVTKVFYDKPKLGLELWKICSVHIWFSYWKFSHESFSDTNLVTLELQLKTLQP